MNSSGIFRDENPINLDVYVEKQEDGRWVWGIGESVEVIATVSKVSWEREEDAKINAQYWLERMGLGLRGNWE